MPEQIRPPRNETKLGADKSFIVSQIKNHNQAIRIIEGFSLPDL